MLLVYIYIYIYIYIDAENKQSKTVFLSEGTYQKIKAYSTQNTLVIIVQHCRMLERGGHPSQRSVREALQQEKLQAGRELFPFVLFPASHHRQSPENQRPPTGCWDLHNK